MVSPWCAPLLWKSEFRNVLALCIRKKTIDIDTACALSREAELLMKPREYQVAAADVLSLTAHSNCSVHDCEFVALACELKTHLVTTDKQLLKSFPKTAVSPRAFAGG